jgi:hypothetical protein
LHAGKDSLLDIPTDKFEITLPPAITIPTLNGFAYTFQAQDDFFRRFWLDGQFISFFERIFSLLYAPGCAPAAIHIWF